MENYFFHFLISSKINWKNFTKLLGQTASWVGQGVLYRNTMKIDHIIEKFRQKNNSYCERERERERPIHQLGSISFTADSQKKQLLKYSPNINFFYF